MNKCVLTKDYWANFLLGDPGEEGRTTMAEHLDKCPQCRAAVDEVERLLKETDGVKAEIRKAVASVNWEALPAVIADRAFAESRKPERVLPAGRPLAWLFWAASAVGARVSPLHGRFPIDNRTVALKEASSLTEERVSLMNATG